MPPRALLTSAYSCFSKLTEFCSFSSSKTFFPMFGWLWPLYPLNCEETHLLRFFLPLAVTIPLFLCLFSLLYLLKLLNLQESALACPPHTLLSFYTFTVLLFLSVLSLLHLFCHYSVPSLRPNLIHEPASSPDSSIFIKSTSFPILLADSSNLPNLPSPSYCSLHDHPSFKSR